MAFSFVALLMLFHWVILHTMWSGKSMQLVCILHFGMLCLSAIRMMFVKIRLTVLSVVIMGKWYDDSACSVVHDVRL